MSHQTELVLTNGLIHQPDVMVESFESGSNVPLFWIALFQKEDIQLDVEEHDLFDGSKEIIKRWYLHATKEKAIANFDSRKKHFLALNNDKLKELSHAFVLFLESFDFKHIYYFVDDALSLIAPADSQEVYDEIINLMSFVENNCVQSNNVFLHSVADVKGLMNQSMDSWIDDFEPNYPEYFQLT